MILHLTAVGTLLLALTACGFEETQAPPAVPSSAPASSAQTAPSNHLPMAGEQTSPLSLKPTNEGEVELLTRTDAGTYSCGDKLVPATITLSNEPGKVDGLNYRESKKRLTAELSDGYYWFQFGPPPAVLSMFFNEGTYGAAIPLEYMIGNRHGDRPDASLQVKDLPVKITSVTFCVSSL